MTVDGELTAEAEGLFVTINPKLAAEYFGRTTGEAAAARSRRPRTSELGALAAVGNVTLVGRGQRIAVIGSGGAGKSTLARQIGAILGLPVIHLDHHYWSPGWVPTPDDEWWCCQRGLLAGDRLGRRRQLRRHPRAAGRARRHDRLPRPAPAGVRHPRALRRVRSPVLQAHGCPQRMDRRVPPLDLALPDPAPGPGCSACSRPTRATTDVVQLRSPAEVRAFLARLRHRADRSAPHVRGRAGSPRRHPR